MSCSVDSVGALEAVLTSSLIAAIFVMLLYSPFDFGDNGSPEEIRNRLFMLGFCALASEFYLHRRDPEIDLLAWTGWLSGALAAGSMTALLYLGPFLAHAPNSERRGWIAVCNLLMAPLVEELVFRRHFRLMWRCVRHSARQYGAAALVMLAFSQHGGHDGDVPAHLYQMIYTMTFCFYSSALLAATDSFVPPLTTRIMYSSLGGPDLMDIRANPALRLVSCVYAASIATVLLSFAPVLHLVSPVPAVF